MQITFITILFLCKLSFTLSADEELPPTVELPLGKIAGSYKTSLKGRQFYSFEGVPYARPPVGKRRFREPQELKPWKNVWVANTIYKCMQYYHYTPPGEDYVIGDEDCLYLNIYTPTVDKNANLDVIVYIHGGAFMFGYGGFQGPRYILDKNVVYVNLNYRLGPLGFLSTESDLVPGNNGIKDQTMALQFIKDNIIHFGGNPKSVTIIGMSAGGASVHTHFMNPKSKNLFHKAVSQSGTALNHWVLMENALEKTKKLATIVGCPTNNLKNLIECLKKRSGKQIVYAVREFQPWLYNPFSPFGLVVDGRWAAEPVLPDHPYNLIKSGNVLDLPWIASHTNSEGLYPASDFYGDERLLEDIDARWNEIIPLILDFNFTVSPELHDSVSQKIRKHYLGDKKVSRENFSQFVQILSDRIFVVDIRKATSLQASVKTSPIYFYYFTYRGTDSKSRYRAGSNVDLGACHGDDTSYIFQTNVDTQSGETDKLMVEFMLEMIISFAKTGKPSVGKVDWPALSKNSNSLFTYLKIQDPKNLAVESIYYENAKFWASLPIKENEKSVSATKKDEL